VASLAEIQRNEVSIIFTATIEGGRKSPAPERKVLIPFDNFRMKISAWELLECGRTLAP
jgi:hypothetical protein